jgi:NAD(P)H-flavin reductase
MLRDHLGELEPYTYLVAGPPAMVEGVAGQLTEAGIPEQQLMPARFSGY